MTKDSDYETIPELEKVSATKPTPPTNISTKSGPDKERRLLRIGILILGLLCVTQAVLNVSLRLYSHSKQPNLNQSCFYHSKQLEEKYQALKTERDRLCSQLPTCDDQGFSGSGFMQDDFPIQV